MNTDKMIRNAEEQGVAAWINYLNQVRLDRLVASLQEIGQKTADSLQTQKENFAKAIHAITQAVTDVDNIILSRRGGLKGIHGFMAETAQKGVANARSLVKGGSEIYEWVNNNGQWDLIKKVAETGQKIPIQQKFVQSTPDHMSLQAILEHLKQYPDSLEVGGMYQIPKDHYEKFIWLKDLPKETAYKLPTSNGEFNLREWEYVQKFIADGTIPADRIEPSELTYVEVQLGKIHDTLANEKDKLAQTNEELNSEIKYDADEKANTAYEQSKPNFTEGLQATAVSTSLEAASELCIAIAKKLKQGKKLKNFTGEDWKEVLESSGMGAVKGTLRGAGVYVLSNYTATPAAVASSLFTASFGVAEQVHRFRNQEIDEAELIETSEILCLDTAISALSSMIGQVAIPVPILGAIIGNTVGMTLYQIAKNSFEKKEQQIIHDLVIGIEQLDEKLSEEYSLYVDELAVSYNCFMSMVTNAFSPDAEKAFQGSVLLAQSLGISDYLTTKEDIEAYFLS